MTATATPAAFDSEHSSGKEADPWELRPGQLLIAEREPHNPRDPHAITLAKTPWLSNRTAAAVSDVEQLSEANNEVTSSRTNGTPVIPGSAAVATAATATLPTPLDLRLLGHLPATLARFLSPLLLRGLITIQVRVDDPNDASTADPADASVVDLDSSSKNGSEDGDEAEKENNHSAATAAATNTPHKRPLSSTTTPLTVAHKRASVEKISIRVDIIPVALAAATADTERSAVVADTASCALWDDLVSFIDSFTQSSQLSSTQRLVSNFCLVVTGVLERFGWLFSGGEVAELRGLLSRPPQAQALFVRLCSRTRPHRWFQLSALRYELREVTQGVQQLSQQHIDADAAANRPAASLGVASPHLDTPEPKFARSMSTPALPLMQQQENVKIEEEAWMDDGDAPSSLAAAASVVPTFVTSGSAFLCRSSCLSMDAWAGALPSMLHECTLASIKDVVGALGLTKVLAHGHGHPHAPSQSQGASNHPNANAKQALISHLTKQRTLFANSMLRCENTRKVIQAVCGQTTKRKTHHLCVYDSLCSSFVHL